MYINELTPEQNRVRELLIAIAATDKFYYYSDLIKDAGLNLNMSKPADRGKIGQLLGAISAYEHRQGRPMLSSLVVTKNFEQGDGFFKLAEELGFGNWRVLKEDGKFEREMIESTRNYWSTHKE